MTPEQIKAFIAEREADRKVLAERIEQLDREIHDLRCRLIGVKPGDVVRVIGRRHALGQCIVRRVEPQVYRGNVSGAWLVVSPRRKDGQWSAAEVRVLGDEWEKLS